MIKNLKADEWDSLEVKDTMTFYVLSGYIMDCLIKSVKKADNLAMNSLRRDYLHLFEGGDNNDDEILNCKRGQAAEWVICGNVAGKKIDGFK